LDPRSRSSPKIGVGSNSVSSVNGRGGMGSLRSPRRGSTASGASRNHHLARSARPTLAIFSEDRRGFEFSLFGQRTGWDGLASLAASREYRVWRASRDHPLPRSARPTLAIFSEDRRGFEFSLFGQRT